MPDISGPGSHFFNQSGRLADFFFLFFCPPLPPFTVAAAASSVFLFERYYLSAVFDYIYFTVSLLPPPFAPHVPPLRPSYIVVTLLPYLSCCSWVRRMLCFG